MAKKQAQDKTSIGFEDKIWKAADVLRGHVFTRRFLSARSDRTVDQRVQAARLAYRTNQRDTIEQLTREVEKLKAENQRLKNISESKKRIE